MKTSPSSASIDNQKPGFISDAQVCSFVDDGYLVVPNLVSDDERAEILADTVHLARGGYPTPAIKPVPPEKSDAAVLQDILCVHQPHIVSPVMRRYAAHTGISQVLSRITAAHLPGWDGAVKCMQSMLFIKPPGKPGQAWHQDEEYIPTRDRSLCGAWIALDDATITNGCLWVVPGSHRMGYLYPYRRPTDLDEYDGTNQSYGFDETKAIPVEVKAGSVVFFNGYLLHKSLKNRSTHSYRRALVNHYCNAWSLLPWMMEGQMEINRRDHKGGCTHVAEADNRNVFMVAGQDPYAWKGYDTSFDQVFLRQHQSSGS